MPSGSTAVFCLLAATAFSPIARAQSDCALRAAQFGQTPRASAEMIRLQNQLADPDFAMTQQFLMKIATQDGRETPQRLPQTPGQTETGKAGGEIQDWPDPYGKYLDIAVLALPAKRGSALAQSFQTIVENQFLREAPMTTAAQYCLQRSAEEVFPKLPFETQWMSLFGNRYWQFATPSLNAYLQRLYESLDQRLPEQIEAEQGTTADPERLARNVRFYRTGILQRIYEADPEMGREMILAEIAAEFPRADIAALTLLPDEVLPSLDAAFAQQLPAVYRDAGYEEYNAKLAVIERYGTAAVLSKMKSVYLSDPDDRNRYHSSLFFSYFLRTDPEFAKQLIAASLARPDGGCSVTLFTEMAAVRLQPALREIAKAYLDDADKCVAGNAAYFFAWDNRGTEASLWQHLEAWHNQWTAKQKEIPYPEQTYEDGLTAALLFGAGPCPPAEVVEKLRPLYIKGKSVDGNISFQPLPSPVKIAVASDLGERELLFHMDSCSGRISLEQLESAIPRFPSQTVFEWYDPENPQRRASIEALRSEIESLIKRQGMVFRMHAPAGGILQSVAPPRDPQ